MQRIAEQIQQQGQQIHATLQQFPKNQDNEPNDTTSPIDRCLILNTSAGFRLYQEAIAPLKGV